MLLMIKKTVFIINQDNKKKALFCDSNLADGFWLRLKGLLGKASLKNDEALIITPCSQVHTIGMRFSIDVIFIDKNQCVTKIVKKLKPYRQAVNRGAYSVIEVAAGMVEKHNITVGAKLTW